MQVLLYITTILMMLAIMTYGRLESFRNLAGAQGEFVKYMEKRERAYLNQVAEQTYNDIVATKEEKDEQDREKQAPGSSKINFAFIVDEDLRTKNEALYNQIVLIAKNLIQFLYSEQTFYQEILQSRPDFLNELFEELKKVAVDEKIKKAKDLATLDLNDQALQMVWYKMLDGTPEEAFDTKEFKKDVGYDSLLDYITINKKNKIRVFLASPQVLMALFGNTALVKQIIGERYDLYKEVVKKEEPMQPGTAAETLRTLFLGRLLPGIDSSLLDFTVSKSYPRRYERKARES